MQEEIVNIPFGLLFEEDAKSPETIIAPIYDDERDLSLIEDANGCMVPLVELGIDIGTDTATKVQQESTDTDPEDDHLSSTITSITTVIKDRSETADGNPEDTNIRQFRSFGLNTDTSTAVQTETTDTDPEDDHGVLSVWKHFLATDTITRREGEITDRD